MQKVYYTIYAPFAILCALLLFSWPCTATARAADDNIRIERPAISLDLSRPFIDPEPNREPIAAAAQTPGIYRGFLVWRQKYAHLAICTIDLCNGSCLAYGDGCLVCAQMPVLPAAMAGLLAPAARARACAAGCAPSYVKQSFGPESLGPESLGQESPGATSAPGFAGSCH